MVDIASEFDTVGGIAHILIKSMHVTLFRLPPLSSFSPIDAFPLAYQPKPTTICQIDTIDVECDLPAIYSSLYIVHVY